MGGWSFFWLTLCLKKHTVMRKISHSFTNRKKGKNKRLNKFFLTRASQNDAWKRARSSTMMYSMLQAGQLLATTKLKRESSRKKTIWKWLILLSNRIYVEPEVKNVIYHFKLILYFLLFFHFSFQSSVLFSTQYWISISGSFSRPV